MTTGCEAGAHGDLSDLQERPPSRGYAPLPLGGAGSAEFQRRALLAGVWMAETVACGGGALNNGALAPNSDSTFWRTGLAEIWRHPEGVLARVWLARTALCGGGALGFWLAGASRREAKRAKYRRLGLLAGGRAGSDSGLWRPPLARRRIEKVDTPESGVRSFRRWSPSGGTPRLDGTGCDPWPASDWKRLWKLYRP